MNSGLIIFLGLGNWLATAVIVDSEMFRPLREWVGRKTHAATRGVFEAVQEREIAEPDLPVELPRHVMLRLSFWNKMRYLIGCHLCTGLWVGFAQAAVFGGPFTGIPGLVMNGLIYKAVGHLTLTVWTLLATD